MGPQRWREVQDLFHQVAELPPGEASSVLDSACTSDPELRAEVESLLETERGVSHTVAEVVQPLAIAFAAETRPHIPRSFVGQRIGPYNLVREIGHGGMGTVYHAVRADDQYLGSVAVKVMSHGAATAETVLRFRIERQILATLHHPYIATLLDGGTTEDERPYIVMEHIEGVPVTEYCQQKDLPIDQRLELFLLICAAVQHAHQQLVIHRDIKPANVLVTEDGIPKLLDFGIAKLQMPDLVPGADSVTRTAIRVFTPQYASPEQIRGQALGTASDIYSLGVLLFEMLTLSSPYRTTKSSLDLERVVCEKEPSRLSTAVSDLRLRRQLAGDLETIVAKALRKEPGRRYASVQQFAEDIQRYRKGLPVSARSDTIMYVAAKFVRRNKAASVAFLLLAISVALGWAATIREAQRTAVRFNEVRRLANSLLFDIHREIQNLPGSTPAREHLVQTALQYLNSLSIEDSRDSSLEWDISQAYELVGDVQGDPTGPNLGHYSDALVSYKRALKIVDGLSAQRRDYETLSCLIWLHYKCGDLELRLATPDTAVRSYERGLQVAHAIEGELKHPRSNEFLRNGHQRMAAATMRLGNASEAIAQAKLASAAAQRHAVQFPGQSSEVSLAETRLQTGSLLWRVGDLIGASNLYQQALKPLDDVAQRDPHHLRGVRSLADAYMFAGDLHGNSAYFNLGETDKGAEYLQRSLTIREELAARDRNDAEAQSKLCSSQIHLATVIRDADPRRAEALYRQALSTLSILLESAPDDQSYMRDLANARLGLGVALGLAGNSTAALAELRSALAVQQDLSKRNPNRSSVREDMVDNLLGTGRILMQRGEASDALAVLEQATSQGRELVRRRPESLYAQRCFALSAKALGDYYSWHSRSARGVQRSQEVAAARNWYTEAANTWSLWTSRNLGVPYSEHRHKEVTAALASLR